MKAFKLDTGSDGCDEQGLEGTRDEVIADVMHHHDIQEWPEHWTLTEEKMDKPEAIETITEIAEDICSRRGDDCNVRQWARSYTHWQDAVDALSAEEVEDAIRAGRMLLKG